MISRDEYAGRLAALQRQLAREGIEVFLVSAEDSIYYLTGVSYRPLERPFFILVRASAAPVLLVPALEREHLRAAPNVQEVQRYWDYPSPPGRGWADRLRELLGKPSRLAVEPTLPQEIAQALADLSPQVAPLV